MSTIEPNVGQAEPRWLDENEDRAWRGYLRMRTLLHARILRDLAREAGLSGPDYDVLSHVSEAPGRRSRLGELAERMAWSRSRLSHHLTRMEQRGLVTRENVPSDGRGASVVLTDTGFRTIQTAAPAMSPPCGTTSSTCSPGNSSTLSPASPTP